MKYISTFFSVFLLIAFSQQVSAQCNATFTFTPGACPGDPVAFFANADPLTVVSYSWFFADPPSGITDPDNISQLRNPTHIFGNLGSFTVKLTVVDTAGQTCFTTQVVNLQQTQTLTVTVAPPAKCTSNPNDTLYSPTFTIDSIHAALGPFTWDFGDGSSVTSAALTQTHTYDRYGTYFVTLTASGAPCPGFVRRVYFYKNPLATLDIGTEAFICEGEGITALNITDTTRGNIDYFHWNFGLYGPKYFVNTNGNQTHVYDFDSVNICMGLPFPGYSDQITLTAYNRCSDHFAASQIRIQVRPRALFTVPYPICTTNPTVLFTNATCPGDDASSYTDPSSYIWDFGDPASGPLNTSTLVNPVHTYSQAGNYTVSLIATNNCGADTFTRVVTVVAFPVALALPTDTQGCVGDCIDFANVSTPVNGMSYLWEVDPGKPAISYGNGTDSVSFEPQICFLTPDTFAITMAATNVCGTDTWTGDIIINLQPFLTLDSQPDSCGTFVAVDQFGLNVLDFGAAVSSINWTFNNGLPATHSGPTPPPVTFGPGTHTLTVDATNVCGTGSVSTSFTIDTLTSLTVPPDPTICLSDPGIALAGSPGPGYWTGTGVDSSGFFVPPGLGTFELVYNFEATHCLIYDTVMVTVVDTPVVTAMADISQCIGNDTIPLVAGPTGGTWSGPNLINGNQFVANTAGTFVFTYSYTDAVSLCPGTDQVVITIFPLPVVNAGLDTTYCLVPDPQQLPAATPAGGTWQGTGVLNPLAGLYRPDLHGTGLDTVVYTFISANGCIDRDTILITIVVGDSAVAGPGDTLCINAGVDTLAGFSPAGGLWSGAGIIGSTAAFDPMLMTPGLLNPVIYTVAPGTSCEAIDTAFVFVLDTLAANAGANLVVCESDDPFFLTGFSPAGGIWSGQGVNPLTGEYDPSLVAPGTVDTVYYSVVNADNCASRDFRTVLVDALPAVDFTPVATGCIGIPVTFTPFAPTATQLLWNYGDGPLPTTSATHTYTLSGNFTITLIAQNANGCRDSVQYPITISEPPAPAFAMTATNGCAPLPVTFTDQGNAAGGSYLWDFGNGQTSTLASPGLITYSQGTRDTTYYISLAITNQCATLTVSDSVLVRPQPQVNFGPSVLSGCSVLPVDFANISLGNPDDFFWYLDVISQGTLFSTDSIPPTQYLAHTPTTGSTVYTVYLVATNACGADTLSQNITVFPNTIDAFFNASATAGCAPLTVQFNGFSGAPFIGWLIDDLVPVQPTSNNPVHTFVNPGIYTVYHYANNGCSYDTNSTQITVYPAPQVDFAPDTSIICQGAPLGFTNLSTGTTGYLWNFGDGNTSSAVNPVHAFDSAGTYSITLTALSDTNACPASRTRTITVPPPPPASFELSDTAGCPDLLVQVSGVPGNLNYFWTFGDTSGPSIQQNPSHLYTVPGTYALSLTTTNAQNCSNDTTALIRVHQVPESDFSTLADTLCGAGSLVSFSNLSSGVNVPLAYLWDFGDSSATSTAIDPSHVYHATGAFTVSLTATNTFGCADVAFRTITILPQPVADFVADSTQGCVPFAVQFTDQSANASGWQWFVDGAPFSSAQNPDFTFLLPDRTYLIELVVNAAGFCFDTASLAISTARAALADFAIARGPFSDRPTGSFQLTDQSQSTLPLTWNWGFGDGQGTSVLQNPVYIYQAPGVYVVRLEVINSFGCRDNLTDTVRVYPQPVADFVADPVQGCTPLNVNFDNRSFGFSQSLWRFGDGGRSTLTDPTHPYFFTDTIFTVTLVVDTAGFCFDSTTVTIALGSAPVADFEASLYEACGSETVTFTNLSTTASLPLAFAWQFGNGDSSSLRNPTASYTAPDEYDVRLVTINSYGCADTIIRRITIYPQAEALFAARPDQGCQPLTVQFSDLSTNATQWRWNLGNGTQSDLQHPLHTYLQVGSYAVSLIASYGGKCADTIVFPGLITVDRTPVANFSYRDSSQQANGQNDGTVVFENQSFFADLYFWDFGDGATSDAPHPTHQYLTNETFTVTLIASTFGGCSDTAIATINPLSFGDLHIPNALAPYAGAQPQDEFTVFKPKGIGLKEYHIAIYSIWGDLVWESTALSDGQPTDWWDGRIGEQVANSDVFVWKVHKAVFENGEHWRGRREGSVTLIR